MPNCPVCNTEYQKQDQQVSFCLTCGWYLRLYSHSGDEVFEGSGLSSSETLQRVENWARQMWRSLSQTLENSPVFVYTYKVTNLFECQRYRSGYSGLKLIKPAIVSSVSRGEVWQLVEPGVLQFY